MNDLRRCAIDDGQIFLFHAIGDGAPCRVIPEEVVVHLQTAARTVA
jgi:hypothetical protein